MEGQVNTYKLKQRDKEYILTIRVLGNSIRISCKNSLNESSECYRDFTVEELHKLDQLFNVINTPNEALDYMDKALKIQKVGVSEENNSIKVNFYVTTQGMTHQIVIPLGVSGAISSNVNNFESSSIDAQNILQTINSTSETTYLGQNMNFGQSGTFSKKLPVITPVNDINQEMTQLNLLNNHENTDYNQINNYDGNDINLSSELVEGNANISTGAVESTYQETQNQYLEGVDVNNIQITESVNNLQNNEISQFASTTGAGIEATQDYASQFTTGEQDINTQIAGLTGQITTETGGEDYTSQFAGTSDLSSQFTGINAQFTGDIQNTTTQYTTNKYDSSNLQTGKNNEQYLQYFKTTTTQTQNTNQFETPYITPADNIRQTSQYYEQTTTTQTQNNKLETPYITPADDININLDAYSQNQGHTNQYYQTTTTTTTTTKKRAEPQFATFSLPLPLVKEPNSDESLRQKIKRTTEISDSRINQLEGTTNSLKSEHQLIQDKLNALTGQIKTYQNQLSLIERNKSGNEISDLRAENNAIKRQLAELNSLRNDAAEVKFLRNQLRELDPLRRKVAEMEVLKGQLGELNALRAKVSEYNQVKRQLNELNNLRLQVAQINILKQQLGELNTLRAKVAELNGIKAQLGELNNLRAQAGQINLLKQQLDELTKNRNNALDLEDLRKKILDLERIKLQYEEEIKNLREAQIKAQTLERTKMTELRKMSESRAKNTGMDSKQLYFEETTQQICVKGDIIHNTDELELLTRKINKMNKRLTLNLLYKATADSDRAEAFHAKCDNARSTLVLVETDKGRRFGGFTTCSWSGDCIDKKDEEAFVFSLDKMEIYENIPGEDAIGCYPKFGPIFLGCQIRIFDNAFTQGGTTFEKGLNFNTEEDFELTGGDKKFNVKDIEVYEVIPQ